MPRFRLCWADKLGLTWGFIAYGFLFVIADYKNAYIEWLATDASLRFLLEIVGIPWIFFRLVDWLFGGPARRKFIAEVRSGRWTANFH